MFVGGPIQNAMGANGRFDAALRRTIECALDALEQDGFRVFSAHRVERFGDEDVTGRSGQIATRDFGWMNACDAFVAMLPGDVDGTPYRSEGTCIELGWASAMGKPIILVTTPHATYSHLILGLGAVARVAWLTAAELQQDPTALAAVVHRALGATPVTVR
ncbi:MAG: hypothetical protein QOJ97_187 [Solirubrobacteraceae bacterium]|nr:hypothetical protein [Solirubrobacteraceae bacterium]